MAVSVSAAISSPAFGAGTIPRLRRAKSRFVTTFDATARDWFGIRETGSEASRRNLVRNTRVGSNGGMSCAARCGLVDDLF